MKKILRVLGAALLSGCLLFTGTAAAEEDEAAAVEDETIEEPVSLTPEIDTSINLMPGSRIAVVSKNTKGDFWSQVRVGMEDAVKKINEAFNLSGDDKITMTFEGPGDEKEVENQINTLDAVIAENPDVLCLCAGDMDSCQPQLEEAAENGIPVVVFDSCVADMTLVSAYRSTDNKKLGVMAGEKMAEALNGEGEVIVFCAQEKTSTSRERVEGLMSVLDEYPDMEVTEVIYDDQVEDMAQAMEEAITGDTELDAVYCASAESAEAYLGLPAREGDPLIFIGTDATKKQQEALRDGNEYGCLSQNAYAMGYQTILAAVQLTGVEGTSAVEPEIFLEPVWIDADNMDDPENADYLMK